MGAKNCPETPRQKMINMMYIVLTAMLALNVASQVLEAFKVVDGSLMQTLKAVDNQNVQIYSSFEQAYMDNPTKVEEWKNKADESRKRTTEMITYISQLKEALVKGSGSELVTAENPLEDDDFYYATLSGDTLKIKKEDDLNGPSELMITQKKAHELRAEIEEYKNSLLALVSEDAVELKTLISEELDTPDTPVSIKDGGGNKSWETQYFLDKPLVAVLTLLSKIQIDIKNAEANLINYLYAQIDAGSFKFNSLRARVIPNSSVVLQGDEFFAEVFMAAEDTTQQPQIFIGNNEVEVIDGKAMYRVRTSQPGEFTWGGMIKYKTPGGIIRNYPFEHSYQVTKPSVTMSATSMNVFYRGLDNPFEVSGGSIPNENLQVSMTNGSVIPRGDKWVIRPNQLDELGRNTVVSVYANIGGERRFLGSTPWRVKAVPDPVAKIGTRTGGEIPKGALVAQDGILAVLEDFDFDYKFTVTQFNVEFRGTGGYVATEPTRSSNRFTQRQKDLFNNLTPNSFIYIDNIKARGDNGEIRDLAPISFKIR